MTQTAILQKQSQTFAYTDLGYPINYEIDITNGKGVDHIDLEVLVTPVGTGTFTLEKRSPFGIISSIIINDGSETLGTYTASELMLLHYLTQKSSPAQNLMTNASGNWKPVASATDVTTGTSLVGTISLPIRISKNHPVNKLTMTITLSGLDGSTGILGVGNFSTAISGASGSFTADVIYDDSVLENWYSHVAPYTGISTQYSTFNTLNGANIRYVLIYDSGYWNTQGAATNPEWLFDSVQFQETASYTPITMNRFLNRQYMQNLLDLDPDFVLCDTTSLAYDFFYIVLPDKKMNPDSYFALKADSSVNVRVVQIEIKNDAPQKAALSPVGPFSLLNKLR